MARKDNKLNAVTLLRGNTSLLVLALLRDGPMHGYGVAHELSRRTEGTIDFKEGTLYPLLHDLEAKGFLCAEWETVGNERPRKVYRLTESGRDELERGLEAWQQVAHVMFQITGVKPEPSSLVTG